ncbi:MAG: cellobiose phosphorylase [Lachnospiraceae bacterium]|nr:cellobiose phosphorylase [Lachnospiraceae bacterium]
MGCYRLEGDTYIIEEFDKLPAFSSFLPGLAGIKGIPLWVYYTNRGQGINSFGIHHKNNAIMEFNPANTAYENTVIKGFRTFLKCGDQYFEPFFTLEEGTKRILHIRKNSFEMEEVNVRHGIRIRVKYTVLPEESIGALVRHVSIENIGKESKEIELIDGLPKIIPYGIANSAYKEMSNLLKSWSDIKNADQRVPYYTMRSSSDDSSEVSEIEGGYFYLTVHHQELLPVIYDAEVIFSYDTSLVHPISFLRHPVKELMERKQCFYNKVPCGFTPMQITLPPSGMDEFYTLVGFAGSPEQINEKCKVFCVKDYLLGKERCADRLVEELTNDIKTHTGSPVFDQYIEQCYLDNFLRGGYPYVFNKASNKSVVHLFSRKHGDPERDYNFFTIAGEYYSQGNGNYRDVNQNRRNDVFFQKDIGDFDIKTFFQLIQIDGYNPLEVRPSTFRIKPEKMEKVQELLRENLIGDAKPLQDIMKDSFTPGQIANRMAHHSIIAACGQDSFLTKLLECCEQNIEAGFGEGYWSDHWDYNMDLVESYLKIYPENEKALLFEDGSYRFYDSPVRLLRRSEKYVVGTKNEVRQYGAFVQDEEKVSRNSFQKDGTNWLKTEDGSYATTTLMGKMISLALNKFATLDAYGMGVEMEGGKPGWNDAMNGLPGLFGSGMSETFELKRLVGFICNSVTGQDAISLPAEIYDFLIQVSEALRNCLREGWSNFTYWDTVSSLREQFRERVRFTLTGEVVLADTTEIQTIFKEFEGRLEEGIKKACRLGDGIVPTYFTFRATEYEIVKDGKGETARSHYGLPKAKVKAFEVNPLPSFLEGPAKMLGIIKNRKVAEELYQRVRESDLFDRELQMYKTSVPIEHISMENGRIRAFTPGWLERESIFLHMEYKYLLSMLKAGLYEKFYEDLPTALVAFRDPAQYGRSVLENSSFLASSANPDKTLHGRGYVARLSGSATEAISLWISMFIGDRIFTYKDGQLVLHLEPKLPDWMFDEKGEVSFSLLSHCRVTYRNPAGKATYGENAARIRTIELVGTGICVEGNCLCGSLAERIRNGLIKELIADLE